MSLRPCSDILAVIVGWLVGWLDEVGECGMMVGRLSVVDVDERKKKVNRGVQVGYMYVRVQVQGRSVMATSAGRLKQQ